MESHLPEELVSSCRTCLEKGTHNTGFVRIFENDDTLKGILDGIQCFQLDIAKDDGLPQTICPKCQKAFASISYFKQQCVRVQKELAEIVRIIASDKTFHNDENEDYTAYEIMIVDEEEESESTDSTVVSPTKYVDHHDYGELCCTVSEDEHAEDSLSHHSKNEESVEPNGEKTLESAEGASTAAVSSIQFIDVDDFADDSHSIKVHLKIDPLTKEEFNVIARLSQDQTSCTISNRRLSNVVSYSDKKFECKFCEKSFKQRHHQLCHERTHTGERPYSCEFCGKDFTQESNLKIHLREHTGEHPYSCQVCGKAFIRRGPYVMHMHKHNNIRPYQCEVCGKKFLQMSTLKVHQRMHTGEKPFKCPSCNVSFSQAHQLKFHKHSLQCDSNRAKSQLETTEKQENRVIVPTSPDKSASESQESGFHPSVCPICSRVFRLPSSLRSHIKCHSEDRKYVCNQCGSTFKRAEHLRIHINGVHLKKKPYSCEICNKSFSQAGDRNVHMKSHELDKSYHCSFCDKGFKLQKSLRAHERIHTGEKPFTCEICHMDFISYNSLAMHTMKHTEDERCRIQKKTLEEFKNVIIKIDRSMKRPECKKEVNYADNDEVVENDVIVLKHENVLEE